MMFKKLLRTRKGTSMVIFSLALVVLMGCLSISVDIGVLLSEKMKIGNAVDAAALAGAQELINSEDNAEDVANMYLVKNGIDPDDVKVEAVDGGLGINVEAKKNVEYYFAKILGFDKGEARAQATAKTLPVVGVYRGIRPFAIENMTLNFGQQYILKEGGGSGSNGNYGALALGGDGACTYRNNIIYGYNSSLKVGDYVDTEPGNMSGPTETGVDQLIHSCNHTPKCTFENYQPDCPRIITVVIVDSLDVNGRKPVKIVGFASFFLEGVDGNGNKSVVRGRFIKSVTSGETSESQIDYGLRGIKLVR